MNKINDEISNKINSYVGAIPKDLQDEIEENYVQRTELCSLIYSEMASLDWIEMVKDSFEEDPEFPSVYFILKDRAGLKKSYSRITPKINGKFYLYLSGSSEALKIAKLYFNNIINSPIIKRKIKEIKESSDIIINIMEDK